MVEPSEWRAPIEAAGLAVRMEEGMQAATLRYFELGGAFAAAVRQATGAALPQPLEAAQSADGQLTLAWRSPTETLLLTPSAERFAQLEARLASAPEGCLVNLSGGLEVLRVTGEPLADLLCRLGGTASVPRPGEPRGSRLAAVPGLAPPVRPGEPLPLADPASPGHPGG